MSKAVGLGCDTETVTQIRIAQSNRLPPCEGHDSAAPAVGQSVRVSHHAPGKQWRAAVPRPTTTREESKPDPSPRQVPRVQTQLFSEHLTTDLFYPRISQLLTSSVLYRRKERKQNDKLHPNPQPAQQQISMGGTVNFENSNGCRNLPLDPHETAPNPFQRWSSPQE